MKDPALVERLVKEQIPLTVCPLSNTKLCVVDDMKNHPLPHMIKAGLRITINSDDPAYFGGYLNQNYEAVSDILDNKHETLAQLAEIVLAQLLLSESESQQLIDQVDTYMKNY